MPPSGGERPAGSGTGAVSYAGAVRRLALVLAAALALGACGDGGGDGPGDAGRSTGEPGRGSGDVAQYCTIGEEIFAVNEELGASGEAFAALGDDATPEEIAAFRANGLRLLTEFHRLLVAGAAVAPSDIREAALILAEAFAVDDEAEAGAAANPLDTPAVQEANDSVADWAAENCRTTRARRQPKARGALIGWRW